MISPSPAPNLSNLKRRVIDSWPPRPQHFLRRWTLSDLVKQWGDKINSWGFCREDLAHVSEIRAQARKEDAHISKMPFCSTFSLYRKPGPPSSSRASSLDESRASESSESTWFDEDEEGIHELARVMEGAEKLRRRVSTIMPTISFPSPTKSKERSPSSLGVRVDRQSIIVVDSPSLPHAPPPKKTLSVRLDRATNQLVKRISHRPSTSLPTPKPAADPFRTSISYFASPSMTKLEDESFLHLAKPSAPLFSFLPPSSPRPSPQAITSSQAGPGHSRKRSWQPSPELLEWSRFHDKLIGASNPRND